MSCSPYNPVEGRHLAPPRLLHLTGATPPLALSPNWLLLELASPHSASFVSVPPPLLRSNKPSSPPRPLPTSASSSERPTPPRQTATSTTSPRTIRRVRPNNPFSLTHLPRPPFLPCSNPPPLTPPLVLPLPLFTPFSPLLSASTSRTFQSHYGFLSLPHLNALLRTHLSLLGPNQAVLMDVERQALMRGDGRWSPEGRGKPRGGVKKRVVDCLLSECKMPETEGGGRGRRWKREEGERGWESGR